MGIVMGAGSGAGQAPKLLGEDVPLHLYLGSQWRSRFFVSLSMPVTLAQFSGLGPQAVLSGSRGNGEEPLAPWREDLVNNAQMGSRYRMPSCFGIGPTVGEGCWGGTQELSLSPLFKK